MSAAASDSGIKQVFLPSLMLLLSADESPNDFGKNH